MGVDLGPLRARVPDSVRAQLPAENSTESWLSALGGSLGELLLELDDERFAAALEELGARGAEAVPALRAAEQAADRARRKRVRRVLHRLRSLGVDVGSAPRTGSGPVLRPVEREAERAFATFIDPGGQRLVFLLVPVRSETRVYEVLVSDVRGVLQVGRFEARRREARRFERELRSRDGSFEIPIGSARALIAGFAEAESAVGGVAAGVDPLLLTELFGGARAGGPVPGELARERVSGRKISGPDAERALRERFERGRLAPWVPAESVLEAARRELASARDGVLVLSGPQRREREATLLAHHAERAFDPATRERLARRLEESAWGLLECDDEEGALAALCAAERLRASDAVQAVPLLRFLFERALGLTPAPEPERSEGGLILPGP